LLRALELSLDLGTWLGRSPQPFADLSQAQPLLKQPAANPSSLSFQHPPYTTPLYTLPFSMGRGSHGGLARVGKVKGQTPKVCTGDKPKAKTGRSKKRMLFGKRFCQDIHGNKQAGDL